MSIFFNNNDENCIDGEALLARDLPLDRLIKHLIELAKSCEPGNISFTLHIDEKFYNEIKNQLGSKFVEPLIVYGPLGAYTILKKN